ncbi:MAG: alpha-hydroxy-acid oxidizing protein [Acidobacteria bacterium]|nr:alpha-hydroxy-acid oxidizing protein [Acidobacteriota bacterium]
MQRPEENVKARRRFLGFLAASPLLMSGGLIHGPLAKMLALHPLDDKGAQTALEGIAAGENLITSADQAFDVLDFEPVARKVLPPAHFGYLATGVDDDATIRANREGYSHLEIRSRRLVDVSKIDMSVKLFGTPWTSPIVMCPVSSQKAFHPDGEVASAKGARAKDHLYMLSTVGSASVEEVTAARGAPIWQQLYATDVWDLTRAIVKRAEAAGCPVLVLTVDLQSNSNRETLWRAKKVDTRDCADCHQPGFGNYLHQFPMFDGLDVSKVRDLHPPSMNWDFVARLKDSTKMKLVIKGIVTREDAELAVKHGVDGLVVSNHGGRGEETLRSTIECLPEVVQGCGGKIPALLDGGIRRGTDIFKALALGAASVGIGRPYNWGLAAFGQPGVEAVLTILRRELETIMRQAGTPSVADITRTHVVPRPA